jgi:hypothetical protein
MYTQQRSLFKLCQRRASLGCASLIQAVQRQRSWHLCLHLAQGQAQVQELVQQSLVEVQQVEAVLVVRLWVGLGLLRQQQVDLGGQMAAQAEVGARHFHSQQVKQQAQLAVQALVLLCLVVARRC